MGNAAGMRRKARYQETPSTVAELRADRCPTAFAPESRAARSSKAGSGASVPKQRHTADNTEECRPGAQAAQVDASDVEARAKSRVLSKACNMVQSILRSETGKCQALWASMAQEVTTAIERWKSTGRWSPEEKKSRLLSDLLAATKVKDTTRVAEAMQHAARLGSVQAATLQQMLDRLVAQEELEGTWRCLASALAEADRFVLQFWLQEAKERDLQIPPEVTAALLSFSAGAASSHPPNVKDPVRDFQCQAEFDSRVREAQANGDPELLRRLAVEASRFGAAPDLAEAALRDLQHGAPKKAARPYAHTMDAEVAALRRMDATAIREALRAYGMEPGDADADHEELVQLLHAARAMSRKASTPSSEHSRRAARSGTDHSEERTASKNRSQMTRDAALICLGFTIADSPGKQQLRVAYKKAALRWHPDRPQNHGNEEEAKRKFQEISTALELLLSS